MCALVIPPAVHAQSPQQQQPAEPAAATTGSEDGANMPVSLDRIREGLQREPKLKLDFLDPSIPLFRVSVQEKSMKLSDYWKILPDTAVSRDVRPPVASTWHNEFLRLTTPKQQVTSSPYGMFGNPAYPVGPSILSIGSAIKGVFTNIERGRIRSQIQEELKQIEATNAEPESEKEKKESSTEPTGQAQTPTQQTPAQQTPAPRNPNDPR